MDYAKDSFFSHDSTFFSISVLAYRTVDACADLVYICINWYFMVFFAYLFIYCITF